MVTPVTGKTSVLAIIGHPVAHSLSPLMHNKAISECGLDFVYVPFDVAPEDLAGAVDGMRCLGVRGFNVTIPHKTEVIQYLDLLDVSAEDTGAVNVVRNDGGILTGFNTDGEGFIASLKEDLSFDVSGKRVLVIGAGGAGRAAVAALCRHGASSVTVANRTLSRAEGLVRDFSSRFPDAGLAAITMESIDDASEHADLLVNTSSVGMSGNDLELVDFSRCSPVVKVYDMVYSPPVTPFLAGAASRGLMVANGAGMLAAQGELAFRIWIGADAPPGLMKRVVTDHFR